MNKFSSFSIQEQHKKTVVFLYTSNEPSKNEIKKAILFTIASKSIINKSNQGGECLVCCKVQNIVKTN